jgi:hypothetical protein
VDAFARTDILQVLFFSVLFGIALSALGDKGRPVTDGIDRLAQVLFRIVGMIMHVAPLGAFGAMAFTIGSFGVRTLAPARRIGAGGHDQQHRLEVTSPIEAPDGLGVVAEYRYAVSRARRPLKVTVPGPYTLSGRLVVGPNEVYPDRISAAAAFVPLLQAELRGLVDAGATIIQRDEPSPAIHPEAGADFAGLVNEAIEPAVGRARLGGGRGGIAGHPGSWARMAVTNTIGSGVGPGDRAVV